MKPIIEKASMTQQKIDIVLVEDADADAELITREIKKTGVNFYLTRVENEFEFRQSLRAVNPDIIISDYILPSFDGMRALYIAREEQPFTPFIIVTGSRNEEIAVDCMKSGAYDYVLKDKLFRLPHVIKAAINDRQRWNEKNITEQALRESETRYKTLFESSIDAIMLIYEGEIVECNQRTLSIFDCPPSYIIGKKPFEYSPIHQYDGRSSKDKSEEIIHYALQGDPQIFEWRHKKYTGELFDTEIHLHRVYIQDKPYLQVILRDITDRKRYERELKKWADIFNSTKMGVAVVGQDAGYFEITNEAFAAMHGYTVKELAKLPVESIIEENEREHLHEHILVSGVKGHHIFESKHIRNDGTVFPVIVDITAVKDDKGETRVSVLNVQDITERKILEEQLFQSQRMESIGTLASGIAHDFNNILGIILGFSTMLHRYKFDDEKFSKGIRTIEKAVKRGSNLVDQILTFARKTDVTHETVDVNSLIKDLVKMLKETFPKTIGFSLQLDEELPPVIIQESQLYQMLLNLCVNARDAMVEKSSQFESDSILSISTRRVQPDKILKRFGDATQQEYVAITIRDTGSGIDKDNLKYIFDPFYTTKGPGKGTGLGLAVVYGIVRSYKGYIDVESEPGVGTAFTMYLIPSTAEVVESAEKPDDFDQIKGGNETILVVEDESFLMDVIHDTLTEKGYQILQAHDGQQGLEVFKEKHKEIDIVITDMGLPKMDGFELFMKIRQIKPDSKVVMASGYLDTEAKAALFNQGVSAFVRKPYQPVELARIVRSVLDRKIDPEHIK